MSSGIHILKLGSLFAVVIQIARKRPGGFLQVERNRQFGAVFVTIGPLFLTFDSPYWMPIKKRT